MTFAFIDKVPALCNHFELENVKEYFVFVLWILLLS